MVTYFLLGAALVLLDEPRAAASRATPTLHALAAFLFFYCEIEGIYGHVIQGGTGKGREMAEA